MQYTATTPLPPLRRDISGQETAPGIVAIFDELGYTDKLIRLPATLVEYLLLMDGTRTGADIASIASANGHSFSVDDFLSVAAALERENFLESERFLIARLERDREFNDLPVRPSAHAGSSYPDDPHELERLLDRYLAEGGDLLNGGPAPIAVVVPHIDFRVGGASYGPAYNALRRSEADTFVVFGVSHQMSYDEFMISEKDFETPLGIIPTDRELIARFRSLLPFEITRNEIAHRDEHSIEFQAVFLRHIFSDRDVRIVPILTGSMHAYMDPDSETPGTNHRLTTLYDTLRRAASELGRTVCYIAGADLCHVGRKFGDEFDARSVLAEVGAHDRAALELIARPDAEGFIRSLALVENRYRVCGVAPIYAAIRASRATNGLVLRYEQWDEAERASAVTFGSVALFA